LRHANPIHAASKSDVSGDQSGTRESQSTAGADTKEQLNTCNRRLFTRALPTYAIQHRPSAALAPAVLPAIRGHRPRQDARRSRRTLATSSPPTIAQFRARLPTTVVDGFVTQKATHSSDRLPTAHELGFLEIRVSA
jgi:hypothetical protein